MGNVAAHNQRDALQAQVPGAGADLVMLADQIESGIQLTFASVLCLQLVAGAEGTGRMCSHQSWRKLPAPILHDALAA